MLSVSHVSKDYLSPEGSIAILHDASLAVESGDAAAITGPSGSGKSTLLYIAGGLEPPTTGTVRINETDPYALTDDEAARFRGANVGFVFQDHCLLPQCSVIENVLAPTLVDDPARSREYVDRARTLLVEVGLEQRLTHRPAQLSGGEKQRVAIARALIRLPNVLLCDEPTGNLDQKNADMVADLLVSLHQSRAMALVLVTHSESIARRFTRRYIIADGRLVGAP
ncbi:MAG: ABC transporter ATP-binding protein [Vicinamibacterales bacterium]|nr:ABC transporter ATP-binding protein [Vicinamibacterales bacterium]